MLHLLPSEAGAVLVVEAEAINEAAQLLSKAQKGDREAKAEIIRRINAEHGRKNGVRSRDGKPPASPRVVYLWQHFINPDNVESNNRKHEKRLHQQTAEIAEVNTQARLVRTPAGDAQETNASLPGSGTQVQIQHPTPAPAHSPPPTHPLQIRDRPMAIIVTSHAFLLVPINHMALYLPHTIFLILILSPVIPLILILIPIPIPIPILILVLISVHMPIPIPVPIPVPIPIPIPVPVPIPILILAPVPVLPSQILVFPPIATVLPIPILVPILNLAPLPITLMSCQHPSDRTEIIFNPPEAWNATESISFKKRDVRRNFPKRRSLDEIYYSFPDRRWAVLSLFLTGDFDIWYNHSSHLF
ncbi:hypothetical protein BS47DRAFT_1398727 [Hydnum rufescens UP504]|uniref:Uncharacterized protein n=1 Tax=Hydnum rufescens UP504 TaxID=1448309 RepID=A0A9P6DR73_9AGAM|nr:hypothetical protein BS47DRAFT_1398727 [Hydnum rufescens UP504]